MNKICDDVLTIKYSFDRLASKAKALNCSLTYPKGYAMDRGLQERLMALEKAVLDDY